MTIYMNASRSRDVGGAIPYMVTFIAKTPFHHIVNILRKDAIPYKALVYARAPSPKNLTNAAGKLSGILIKKIKDGFEWI